MMILKFARGVWFFSLLFVTAALLYGYASLPREVVIYQEDFSLESISRDSFFYVILGFLTLINVLVFLGARTRLPNNAFHIWFYGLITTFNIFFFIGIWFIAIFNSGEKVNFSGHWIVIYGSVGLFSLWAIGWPVYWGVTRLTGKS